MTLDKIAAIVVGTLALTFISPARPQEPKHAPSVEHCRADVAVWYSEADAGEYIKAQETVQGWHSQRAELARLSIREHIGRMYEMKDCSPVEAKQTLHISKLHSFTTKLSVTELVSYVGMVYSPISRRKTPRASDSMKRQSPAYKHAVARALRSRKFRNIQYAEVLHRTDAPAVPQAAF